MELPVQRIVRPRWQGQEWLVGGSPVSTHAMWARIGSDDTCGPRWKLRKVRNFAWYLGDFKGLKPCVVWLHVTGETSPTAYWYIAAEDPEFVSRVVASNKCIYRLHGTSAAAEIPAAAEPVLMVDEDLSIIRLWAPPGPKIPSVHTTSVEGDEFEIHERCFVIDGQG